MHLKRDCYDLSEATVNGVPDLVKIALLICNKHVEEKRQESCPRNYNLRRTSETQLQTLENKMTDLKKTVTKIKMLLTTKQPDSNLPTPPSLIASRQEPPPKPAEEPNGIRLRGILESTD